MLTGVFIYWGWESAVNLNEETEDSDSAPGLAAVFSTVILLGTYVITTIAVVSYAGLDRIGEFEDDAGIFGALATDVLGSPLDKLVVLAIITSALSSTQTTILPASRTTLSMARQHAFPAAFGKVHPRYLTPHVSTIVIGAVAAVWFGVLFPLSENFVYDSLTALSLMIAFYYALTGFACAIYYRRELTKSVKNFLFIGVGPVVGVADARLPVLQGGDRVLEDRPELLGQRAVRDRDPGGARHRAAAARRGADADLARGRAPGVLRAQDGDRRSRRRRGPQGGHRRRPGGGGLMATIVLGYDASPGAERALDTAVELAGAFGDRLVIGFGVQPPGHGGGEGPSTATRCASRPPR